MIGRIEKREFKFKKALLWRVVDMKGPCKLDPGKDVNKSSTGTRMNGVQATLPIEKVNTHKHRTFKHKDPINSSGIYF